MSFLIKRNSIGILPYRFLTWTHWTYFSMSSSATDSESRTLSSLNPHKFFTLSNTEAVSSSSTRCSLIELNFGLELLQNSTSFTLELLAEEVALDFYEQNYQSRSQIWRDTVRFMKTCHCCTMRKSWGSIEKSCIFCCWQCHPHHHLVSHLCSLTS